MERAYRDGIKESEPKPKPKQKPKPKPNPKPKPKPKPKLDTNFAIDDVAYLQVVDHFENDFDARGGSAGLTPKRTSKVVRGLQTDHNSYLLVRLCIDAFRL